MNEHSPASSGRCQRGLNRRKGRTKHEFAASHAEFDLITSYFRVPEADKEIPALFVGCVLAVTGALTRRISSVLLVPRQRVRSD